MMMRFGALVGMALAVCASSALAQETGDVSQKVAICGACHGTVGVPADASYPVIWGQYTGYIFIELRDYQTGARKNPIMAAVVQGMSHADMLAIGEYFGAKPWPDLNQPSAPGEVATQAESMATSGQCTQCHLGGFLGQGTNPRLAGQSIQYLRATMINFHTGARGNNPWMSALLKTFSDKNIDDMARYLGGLSSH